MYKLSATHLTLRFTLFCASILIYALFGYPTPDSPRIIEGVIGLGLALSLGLPQNAFILLVSTKYEPLWMKTSRILLLYGLTLPLLMALLNGNEIGAIFRDLFPFLFMLLPFFVYDLFQRLSYIQAQTIFIIILISGLLFSFRGLLIIKDGIENVSDLDALYLVNSPTVLFAALFLSGYALSKISLRRPILPLMCAGLCLFPILSMGAVLQRASFGALLISNTFLSLLTLRQSILKFILIICAILFSAFILKDFLTPLLSELFEKNRAVGSNMRLYELMAVWERVCENSLTALFGQGWGGTVQSPAVGDLTVNFTHSLISASLLKTGLIGTFLVISYLGTLFLRFPYLYKCSPILALSLFWPFVIDIFLYASYKSLDFGFILMLIACYGVATHTQTTQTSAQNFNDQQGSSSDRRSNRTSAV